MADDNDDDFDVKFREDEELEFFTELALHETERWIQAVTKRNFNYPDDIRKSLENGVLLCELANSLVPGAIRRINKLPTPIAGLDNINVFLKACKTHFGLGDGHLFNPSDLEDLSQRAIGESDRLKEEYDKRLRNVAVTVYWLGRYASTQYQGPQLDQSAFSALVHSGHQTDNHIVDHHQSFPSPGNNTSSASSNCWEWTNNNGNNSIIRTSGGAHHGGDGSFDSFSKDSVSSLDAMPHPTMSSDNNSYRDGQWSDRPTGSVSHRRYSSTDSMEGSLNSGHSRQGSDSNDTSYPTRRMSAQMTRRQSTGGDPLQFIKGKPSTELAELAQNQMKVAQESKKVAITTAATLLEEDDPTDWQANLSTWKNRRKSQSERSYQMKEELEKMEREKEGGGGGVTGEKSVPLTKTYSQMAEERERRKSVGRHFYPIQDEEEDDIFAPAQSNETQKSVEDPFTVSNKPRAEIAPWARDEVEEEKKDNKNDKQADEEEDEEEEETSESEDEEINNNKENENGLRTDKGFSSPASRYKSSAYNSKDADNDFVQKESVQRSYAAPQRQSSRPTAGNNNDSSSSPQDLVNRNESFKGVGPRTQSKIGSIMNKFQESQGSSSGPKQGYNERIDLKARMKSFQGLQDTESTTSSENQNGTRRGVDARSSNFSNYRNSFDQNEESLPSQPSSSALSVSHSVRERSKSASSDSKRNSDRPKQVQKTIKIRQKPNDDKGFGFILTGGTDQDKPLTVSKVALGSGADICELKVKDEIVSINQSDVTDLTSMEVGDMVAKAVGKGFIELTVHRERSLDDFSDEEEMTSSSDEGEEDLGQEKVEDDVIRPVSQQHAYSAPEPEMKDPEPVEISEEIQAVHVDREQSAPKAFTIQPVKTNQQDEEEDEDEEDGGPPSILRKWQRQRQRNEYAFENSPSLDSSDSPIYKKISLNAPIPKVDNDDNADTKWRQAKPWDHMQEEWTTQQDQERMPATKDSQHEEHSDEQANFDARQQEIKRQYEESLKIAEQKVEEKSKQEQELLQPEIDKARILEERRMQRRNRIQETVAAATQPPVIAPTSSSLAYEPPMVPSSTSSAYQQAPPPSSSLLDNKSDPEPKSHVTSMTFNIEGKDDNNSSKYNITPASFNIPRQPGNDVIIIDPRNRGSPVQDGTPLKFQVKLAPKPHDDINARLAQEEKERQRLEEEKMKIIQDKERQLQEQEELLRQERERFRREQEEFRERQQQLQLQQQQQAIQHQQHSYPPPPPTSSAQEPDYIQRSQHYSNFSSPSSSSPHNNLVQNQQQQQPSSLSPSPSACSHINSSSVSPVQFPSTSSAPNTNPYNSGQGSSLSSSKPTWPPQSNQRSPQTQPRGIGNSYNSPRSFKSVNNTSFASVQPQFNTTITTSNNQPVQGGRDRFDAPKGKFSREDMLAMNKKPFHESVASRVNQVENQSRVPDPSQNRMPIPREPPIKAQQNQGHPLNAAPKARIHDDREWQDPNKHQQAHDPKSLGNRENVGGAPRRPAYGSPQDHWLVQEAERRRVSGQGSRAPPSQSGPIKPLPDISNRWRDNSNSTKHPSENTESMPHALRQTLLQKTAGARGSDDGYLDTTDTIPTPQHHHSLQQQPISNRSVSPRSGGGNNNYQPQQYQQQYPDYQNQPPLRKQPQQPQQPQQQPQQQQPSSNSSYSPGDFSNKYNVNPIHQIQQAPPPTLNRVSPQSRNAQQQQPQGYHINNSNNNNHPPPPHTQRSPGRENGLPVNGSQLCSYCNQELGFGAAMVIESLGIFFHLPCFRCCVCHASLGTGTQGADVRVRMNKLHCQNCYSNDEAGLKFSKV